MYDVTAIGELLIDFASEGEDEWGYPLMKANPGGAPGNFLAALSRYGARTAFLGKVGDDRFGHLLIRTMAEAGIETRGIAADREVFTTLAFVTFSGDGERSFSFARKPGADTCLRFEELDLSLIDESRVFHFGSLSLTDEPSRTAVRKAAAYAREKGKMITFDPNLRLPLWRTEKAAKEEILWGISAADVVKISGEEAEFLWGEIGPEAAAEKMISGYGVKLAMVTLGPDGCFLSNQNASARAACPPVTPVDTTGAGDIFGGSALAQILKTGKEPEALTKEELGRIGAFACAAASLSTQKQGGIPSIPSAEEAGRAAVRPGERGNAKTAEGL